MRAKRLWIFSALVLTVGAYTLWALSDRGLSFVRPQLQLGHVETIGSNQGAGNLVAIEPWMTPDDYSSERAFDSKLRGYFEAAKSRGWLNPKTIVVLPEYLGTWLPVANEKRSVYRAPSIDAAMSSLIASNIPPATISVIASPVSDRARYAALSFKSDKSAEIYDRCLSGLAKDYGVTLVGGSIVLPDPTIKNGRLRAGKGRLFNATPVYQPDGQAYPLLSLKCFPINDEKPFTSAGMPGNLPAFETPAGRLGVLICADAWYPESYSIMREKGVQIIACPIFGPEHKAMNQPWRGYSGWPAPSDVSPRDIGRITEREALFKYGLGGRMPSSGISAAISSCNGGRLWDKELGTLSTTFVDGKTRVTPEVEAATVVCLWLPRPSAPRPLPSPPVTRHP